MKREGRRLPDEEYNLQWLARVRARCIVDINGCWVWQGQQQKSKGQRPDQPGYGATAYRGRTVRIHRKTLELKLGKELPTDVLSCHTCDNKPCCNPDHLFPGTCKENVQDSISKGVQQFHPNHYTHCKRGHEFTPENTWVCSRGWRNCRECNRIRLRKEWADGRGKKRQRRFREQKKAEMQQVQHTGSITEGKDA